MGKQATGKYTTMTVYSNGEYAIVDDGGNYATVFPDDGSGLPKSNMEEDVVNLFDYQTGKRVSASEARRRIRQHLTDLTE